MRLVTIIAAIIFFLTGTTLPLYAQWLPWNIGAESSFRVEYLIGTQTLGNNVTIPIQKAQVNVDPQPANIMVAYPNPIEGLRIDFNNSQVVLDGVVGLTPFSVVSSRVRGSVSLLNSDWSITIGSGPVPIANSNFPFVYDSSKLSAVIKPQFWSWEAAGLYNLSYEGVYRYGIVAGYRQESWSYPTSNGQGNNSYLRDLFVSQIPFLGLQTVMFSPLLKGRLEVLGSPFMTKKIAYTTRDQGFYMQLDGNMTQGGFIEFQVEGNINVTLSTCLGLYAQYTYEQLDGELNGTCVDGKRNTVFVPTAYNFYTLEDIWTIGLNYSLLF